jgi:hypothetical protein
MPRTSARHSSEAANSGKLMRSRAHLRVGGRDPVVPASSLAVPIIEPTVTVPAIARSGSCGQPGVWPSTRRSRQRPQQMQDLFDRFKGWQATKWPMSVIARQLGLNRRRFERWAKVDASPTRSPMPSRPRSAEPFRSCLRQRWDAGYRNGQVWFDEICALGYTGTHKTLNRLVTPWRMGNVAFEGHAPFPHTLGRARVGVRRTVHTGVASTHRPDRAADLPRIAAALLSFRFQWPRLPCNGSEGEPEVVNRETVQPS